jgi:hypothetical protein
VADPDWSGAVSFGRSAWLSPRKEIWRRQLAQGTKARCKALSSSQFRNEEQVGITPRPNCSVCHCGLSPRSVHGCGARRGLRDLTDGLHLSSNDRYRSSYAPIVGSKEGRGGTFGQVGKFLRFIRSRAILVKMSLIQTPHMALHRPSVQGGRDQSLSKREVHLPIPVSSPKSNTTIRGPEILRSA